MRHSPCHTAPTLPEQPQVSTERRRVLGAGASHQCSILPQVEHEQERMGCKHTAQPKRYHRSKCNLTRLHAGSRGRSE